MLDIDIVGTPRCALVRVSGILESDDEIVTLFDAVAFVPDDDDLVIDLTGLALISVRGAAMLCGSLLRRLAWAEAVVVSPAPDVTMQLVLGEVDRVVPIVGDVDQALQVIDSRRRVAPLEVGT